MSKPNAGKPLWWQGKMGWIILLLAAGLIFLGESRKGELLNYDDERYIDQNELIQALDLTSLTIMFSAYFDGHYHPITLMSLALDRAVFKDEIRAHHTVNLVLHLLNAILAYLFLLQLFKQQNLAFFVALLFLLHPMNVESYAWMTERKNLLYTAFFLAACLSYLKYLNQRSPKFLLLTFVLFSLSILSKAQAMTFIPVMFLLDYLATRKRHNLRIYLEKLPFILLAVGFVVLTTSAQTAAWGELQTTGYGQVEKLALACFAFMNYLVKGLIPYDLSAYYPYPSDYGASLGWYVYASIIGALLFLVLLYLMFRQKRSILFFGLAFFLINIFLMLKYLDVPYGNYYLANRYNYLPLMGLLVVPTHLLLRWTASKKIPVYLPLAVIAILFGLKANARIAVWNNSIDLWTDVLDHYPKYSHALNMRALGNIAAGRNAEAVKDFAALTALDPDFAEAYLNLAVLHYRMNDPKAAARWTSKALGRFPEDARFYHLSANINLKAGDKKAALKDIEQAIALTRRENPEYLFTRAQILVQLGRGEEAIPDLMGAADLPKALRLLQALQTQNQQGQSEGDLLDRATRLAKQGRSREALELFDKVIKDDPGNKTALMNRGSTYGRLGQYQEALNDFSAARVIDEANARIYYLLGVTYLDMGEKALACQNFGKAVQLGWQLDQESINYCKN